MTSGEPNLGILSENSILLSLCSWQAKTTTTTSKTTAQSRYFSMKLEKENSGKFLKNLHRLNFILQTDEKTRNEHKNIKSRRKENKRDLCGKACEANVSVPSGFIFFKLLFYSLLFKFFSCTLTFLLCSFSHTGNLQTVASFFCATQFRALKYFFFP